MVISKILGFFTSSDKSKHMDSNIKHSSYIAGSEEVHNTIMQLLDIIVPSSDTETKDIVRFAVNDPVEYSKNEIDNLLVNYADAPDFVWLATLYALSEQSYIHEVDWKQEAIDIFEILDDDLKKHLSDNEYERIKAMAESEVENEVLMPDKFFEEIKKSLASTPLRLIFFVKNSDSYVFGTASEDSLETLSQIAAELRKLLQVKSKANIDITT